MQAKREINVLWEQFQDAISEAYAASNEAYKAGNYHDPRQCLKDYAKDIGWTDALARLLGKETAHERRHRSGRPYEARPSDFPLVSAAKLLLMENAKNGANLSEMPPATIFITYRDSAAEAWLVGWLARGFLSKQWRERVAALDYAKLMK